MSVNLDSKTDFELLEAYAFRSDESAFSHLAKRHLPLVYGLASREIYDFRLAEEITQNVLCALARAARQHRELGCVSAWLYGATRKQIAATMRSERRRKRREERAAVLAQQEQPDQSGHLWKDLVPQLNEALGKLSLSDQKILFLRFYEGHSLIELGDALRIKERAAQKRLQRAIERLRTRLGKCGVRLTAPMLGSGLFTAGAATPPDGLILKTEDLSGIALQGESGVRALASIGTLVGSSTFIGTLALVLVTSVVLVMSDRFGRESDKGMSNNHLPSQTLSLLGSSLAEKGDENSLAVDDIEGIYRLSERDRERALDRLMLHLREAKERPYLADLYERWEILDFRRAASSLVLLFDHHNQQDDSYSALLGELMPIPIATWMLEDPDGMKMWAKQLPRTSYAEAYAFEAVLIEIAKRDHQDAWEWLTQRPFNNRRVFESLVAQVTTTLDVKGALDWFASLPADRAFEGVQTSRAGLRVDQAPDRSRAELWKSAVNRLYQRDRQAVGEWVATLPASLAADEALTAFAGTWATEEPRQAAEWALALDQSNRESAVQVAAAAWAGSEPRQSVQWSIDLDDEGLRWSALSSAFTVWINQGVSHQDVEGLAEAAHWLREFAEEPQAASLFEVMSQSLAPAESIRWANTLKESDNRIIALDHAYYRIGRDDPDAALSMLEGLSSNDSERAAEMISLGSMIAGQRDVLAAWRSQLPKESPLFYDSMKAEIQLVATFDPKKAGRVIHSLPATRQRDALIVALIERMAGRSASYADQAMTWTNELVQRDLRASVRQYVEQAQMQRSDLTPLPEVASPVPFAKQTLTQLRQRLDHASQRRSPFQP